MFVPKPMLFESAIIQCDICNKIRVAGGQGSAIVKDGKNPVQAVETRIEEKREV